MTDDFHASISTKPPSVASSYSPAKLMRNFISRTHMSDVEVSLILSDLHQTNVRSELVGSWSNVVYALGITFFCAER